MLPNTWLFTAPVMPEKQEKQWACTRIPNRREGVMSVVFSCSFFMTASKWGSENHFLHVLQMFSKIVFRHSITESKKLILDSVLIGTRKLGGTATTLLHFRHTTTQPHFTLMKWKKKKRESLQHSCPAFFFFASRTDPVIWSLQIQTICGFSTGNQTTLWSRRLSSSGKN